MRPRLLSAGAALAAALLVAGPGAAPGRAVDDTGLASGSAAASSVFITYFDDTTIFPGGTLPPLDTSIGFSSGDIDRSGSSSAVAAIAYSPYVDLPPAVNALAGTNINFDPILTRARASVTGQPPKDATASLTTPTDLTDVGTAEVHLSEGPKLEAFSKLLRLEPAPGTHIKAATSRITIAKVSGDAITTATTVLRSVSIADLLTFDSITLTSTTKADGGAGDAQGSVAIEGASIAGTPVRFTETGIQVADQIVPVDLAALEDALAQAGVTLVGPGVVNLEPGGERSVATATGPQITITDPQNHTIKIILGRAIASSTLLAGFVLPPIPGAPPVVPPVVQPPVDFGPPAVTPPGVLVPQQPTAPGPSVVDLSRLVLSDARSLDAFAALYGAMAAGGLLVLAGLVVPRRRSVLEERLR